MRDGSVRTWMNFKNPDVIRSAGPIDPEVGLLLVRSAETKQPLGTVQQLRAAPRHRRRLVLERRLSLLRRAGAAEIAGDRSRFDLRKWMLRRYQSHRSAAEPSEIRPTSSAGRWPEPSSRPLARCIRSRIRRFAWNTPSCGCRCRKFRPPTSSTPSCCSRRPARVKRSISSST